MDRKLFCLGTAVAAIAPRIVGAQTMSVTGALDRLFTAAQVQPQWFSATFLAAVPLDTVQAITAGIQANLGTYQGAMFTAGRYTLTFARGSIRADADIDAAGAFTMLLVNNMISTDALDRIAALFRNAPVPATWFSASFLTAVPIDKANAIVADVKTRFGAFRSVVANHDGSYTAAFDRGNVNVAISLGADQKIEGLLLRPV